MWKVVKKPNEERGCVAATVGQLKEILALVPDWYILNASGGNWGILKDVESEQVLIESVSFLEDVLDWQKENAK